jgi:hypothetical protein
MNKHSAMTADPSKDLKNGDGVFEQIGNTRDGLPIFSPSDAGDILDLVILRAVVQAVAGHRKDTDPTAR